MSNSDSNLTPVRQKIDAVDEMLFFLLVERIGLSQQVAEIKREIGKEIFDPKREEAILKKLESWIEREELTDHKEKILQLWNTMLELSREVQKK